MKLYRERLINFENDWLDKHPNKNNNPQEYLTFIDGLKEIISKYEYENDDRFVTYGRREFLRKEFSDYLNERIFCGRGKFNDAFVDLAEYYWANTWISMGDVPDLSKFHEIVDKDVEYKNDGIICKQEIDIIKEMIEEFETHLKSINNK